MTFLNPLALFALAAAAIPLIVHLFNFRRPRRVEFSSLVFLRELERSTMQRVRIQQWLLLILRTLAIACLVLAFARPTVTGRIAGALGDAASGPVALVIDNSLSMATLERSGERFRTAKDAALNIIAETGTGDEIVLVTTADGALSDRPMRRSAATEAIARLQLRPYAAPLVDRVTEAGERLRETSIGSGEVYVLSDFQETTIGNEVAGEWPADATLTLVPVGERVPANLAVTSARLISRILDVDQPVRVQATITNHAPSVAEDLLVSLYIGDERVAQASATIPADGAAEVPLTFTPRVRGWHEGRVVIDDESFSADNVRFFSLFIPERRRILVVRGSERSTQNLVLALSPEVSDGRIVFERDVVPASSLAGQSPGAYDAVVLAGVQGFSSGEIGLIATYVQEGGGLLLYPGSGSDREAYNALLGRLGGGVIREVAGSPGSGAAIAEIGQADLEHPVFEGVFEDGADARLEQAEVYAAMRYDAAGDREQTVLALSNGWPLMQEIRSGSGTALFLASALDPAWNDLAVRGLFVPLVYRSLFYLAASETDLGEGMVLSENADVRLAEEATGGGVRIVSPAGEEISPDQRSVFGTRRVTVEGPAMNEPGFARVVNQQDGSLRHLLAVNLDPAESHPGLLAPSEAAAVFEERVGAPARVIAPHDGQAGFARELRQSRRGVEIWNVFLLLALGFLVAEMLVAKRWKPEAAPV